MTNVTCQVDLHSGFRLAHLHTTLGGFYVTVALLHLDCCRGEKGGSQGVQCSRCGVVTC